MNVYPKSYFTPSYLVNNSLDKHGLVVGIGSLGCNAVNYQYLFHRSNQMNYLAVDTSLDRCMEGATPVNTIYLHRKPATASLIDAGNLSPLEKLAQQIALLESKYIYLLVALGNVVNNSLAIGAAMLCKAKDKIVLAVVAMPFANEGERTAETAQTILRVLQQEADSTLYFYKDQLLGQTCSGWHYPFQAEFINYCFHLPVMVVLNIVKQQGIVSVDESDIKFILRQNKYMGVGMALTNKRNWVEHLFHQLIDSPYLKPIAGASVRYVLYNIDTSYHNQPMMDDIDAFNLLLEEHFDGKAQIIIGLGIDNSLDTWIRLTCIVIYFNPEDKD